MPAMLKTCLSPAFTAVLTSLCWLWAAPHLRAQMAPSTKAQPIPPITMDSSYLGPNGAAHITRVVPIPTTIRHLQDDLLLAAQPAARRVCRGARGCERPGLVSFPLRA